ncbi:MAG: DUF2157 domain-containing protein [Moraxella sp.]|nr:DUF2157 domain-containing protein [Moraxella sp.]
MTTTAPLTLTHPTFNTQLNLIGIGLIISSIIYFLASNWFGMSPFMRMGIPMFVLALSAIASVVINDSKKYQSSVLILNTLHTICAIMAGLTLAVIGQQYQTGADAYQLFLYWSILSLLWLYRHNTPVFILWCFLSHLALYFYVKQTFIGLWSVFYFLSVNALLLLQGIMAIKIYPKANIVLSAFLAILSIFSSVLLMDDYQDNQFIFFLSMLLLPSLALWHFYQHKKQGSLALLSLGFGIALFMQILTIFDIDFSFGALFFYAFIALAMFFGIGYGIIKMFPKGIFHQIPIVFGSWIAGILLAGAFLIFWKSVSLFFGIVGFIGALVALYQSKSLFARQFFYTIMLASQIAILFQAHDMINNINFEWVRMESLILLSIQLVLMGACLFVRPHWFVAGLQALASYGFLVYFLLENDYGYNEYIAQENFIILVLQAVILLVLPLLFYYKEKFDNFIKNCGQAVLLFILGVIAFSQFHLRASIYRLECIEPQDIHKKFDIIGLSPELALIIVNITFVGIVVLSLWLKPHKKSELIALFIFGGVLAILGYMELFVLLLGLLWADIHKAKIMRYVYLLAIGLFLWWLYYKLELSFLYKSLTIFISGILFLALAFLIKKSFFQKSA